MHSGPGIGFAVGGAAALLGAIFRILGNRNMAVLEKLYAETKVQLTEDAQQKLTSLQKRQNFLNLFNTWALVIAVLFMATARYLVF
jgi:hypothetical protein